MLDYDYKVYQICQAGDSDTIIQELQQLDKTCQVAMLMLHFIQSRSFERIEPILTYLLHDASYGLDEEEIHKLWMSACRDGNLLLVDWLCTSPDNSYPIDIHYENNNGLVWACVGHHIDLIEYLLTSPKLSKHIAWSALDDYFEKWCLNHNYIDFYIRVLSLLKNDVNYQEIEVFP